MLRPSATSAANASNWSAGCMASRCTFSVRLAVRAVPSATQARHLPFLANAVLFRQQLQRCEATVTGHDLVMLAIGGGNHDEVLQQADTLDAGGEFGNGHARGLAHVAASGTRHQPRQRNQNQVLGRISGFQRDSGGGVDGAGFGLGNGVHGDNSYRFRDAAAKKATRAAACPCRVGIQAFNWRMPSASSQRARFSRMFWSMPCTGRVCCRRPGAAATQPALGQVFLGAVEHAPQVGAAVVEAARHQDLRFRDGRGLVGVVVLEGERGAGEHFGFAIVQGDAAHGIARFLHPIETAQDFVSPSMTRPATSPLWGTRTRCCRRQGHCCTRTGTFRPASDSCWCRRASSAARFRWPPRR